MASLFERFFHRYFSGHHNPPPVMPEGDPFADDTAVAPHTAPLYRFEEFQKMTQEADAAPVSTPAPARTTLPAAPFQHWYPRAPVDPLFYEWLLGFPPARQAHPQEQELTNILYDLLNADAEQQTLVPRMPGIIPPLLSTLKQEQASVSQLTKLIMRDPALVVGPPAPADNDFLPGRDDPQGLRCPLGAHIRRMNPRDSFEPGSQTQVAISNRHRILRVSRRFSRPATGQQPPVEGLMFMCLNADIERQFEFLQQTWGLGANFHGLDNEVDPLLATGSGAGFSIPSGSYSRRLPPLPRFTTLLGGGYFLLPGKDLLDAV